MGSLFSCRGERIYVAHMCADHGRVIMSNGEHRLYGVVYTSDTTVCDYDTIKYGQN